MLQVSYERTFSRFMLPPGTPGTRVNSPKRINVSFVGIAPLDRIISEDIHWELCKHL